MSTEARGELADLPTINGVVLGPTIAALTQGEGPEAELFHASVYGDSQRVRDLLAADSGLVNLARDLNREPYWTPMFLACMYGQREVMEMLFDRGASLDWRGHGETLLHHAAANSHAAVVEFLIQRGAEVNALRLSSSSAKVTPLLRNVFRVDGGDKEVVRLLLQAGADPDIRTGSWSALAQAAGAGNIPVVKVLLEFGADVNTRTPDYTSSWDQPYFDLWPIVEPDWGDTCPLYGAVCSGSIELVNLLLDQGADINALSYGWTALHAAAGQGNCQMVELLLARGADIGVKSSNGKTAIELLSGHKRSAALLREAMDRKRVTAPRSLP